MLGKLNWCSRVVRGGRTFFRRLIDLSKKLRCNHHKTWINADSKADLTWWSKALDCFHGNTSFVQDIRPPQGEFFTDACRVSGGAVFMHDWFYSNFEADAPGF